VASQPISFPKFCESRRATLEKGTGIKELPNKIGTQNPMHFLLLDAETNIKKLPDLLDWIASVLSGERLEITSKQQHL